MALKYAKAIVFKAQEVLSFKAYSEGFLRGLSGENP